MRRKLQLVSVVLMLGLVVPCGAAFADQGTYVACGSLTNPRTGTSNFFNGYAGASTDLHGAPTYEGASASIRVESARICDDSADRTFNTTWVMIAGISKSTGLWGYAQTGALRYRNDVTYHFFEYNATGISGLNYRRIGPEFGASNPLANGEIHRYWVQFSPSKGAEEMNIDISNIADTPFNPYAVWNLPLSVQYFGESIHQGTDTPGYVSNPALFTNMQAQAFNDVFYPNVPAMTAANDQSRFYLQQPIGDRTFYGYTAG
jgi:hypothetical protein